MSQCSNFHGFMTSVVINVMTVHLITCHNGTEVGVEVQFYSFFNLGTRWELVVNAMPQPLYIWE